MDDDRVQADEEEVREQIGAAMMSALLRLDSQIREVLSETGRADGTEPEPPSEIQQKSSS